MARYYMQLRDGTDATLIARDGLHPSGTMYAEWCELALEPGVLARDTDVSIPTSGRRSYRVQLADGESATRLAGALGDALRAYRRDRMGLDDA